MTLRRASSLALAAALAVLLAGAVGVQVVRDRWYGQPQPGRQVLYVRSGEALKRVSLSYSAVLADVYWLRALQHYGGQRLAKGGKKDYTLLYPLLDITTTLDPSFVVAYRFGAIFLAEGYPGGAGRPDLAVRLLEKGVRHRPDYWRYLQDIGFVYYWWAADYQQAAAWFEKAARVPGAPWWMKSLAAVTLAEGGDRRSSRLLWQSLVAGADNDWLRNEARRRLAQLDAMDQMDQLETLVRVFTSRVGRLPSSWEEMVRVGFLRGVPSDPTGTRFLLDPRTGRVTLLPESVLNPLPKGQQGMIRR